MYVVNGLLDSLLACLLWECFNDGAVVGIEDTDLSEGISDEHSPFERVKGETSDFSLRDIREDLLDIAGQCVPEFNLVASGRIERELGRNERAADRDVVVNGIRVVVLVVLVDLHRSSAEGEFQRLRYECEVLRVELVFLI